MVEVVITVTAFQKWPNTSEVRARQSCYYGLNETDIVACGDLQFHNLIKILTVCLDWKKIGVGEKQTYFPPLYGFTLQAYCKLYK